MDRLRYEPYSERRAHATDGVESWSAIGTQGFVQSFASDPSPLSDLHHPASASNITQGRSEQRCIVGFQNAGQVGSDRSLILLPLAGGPWA